MTILPPPQRRWHNAVVPAPDTQRTRRLLGMTVLLAISVLPTAIYVVGQLEYVRTRYRIEELRRQYERLVEMEQRLRVERASLSTPLRIEEVALRELGLVVAEPEHVQVVLLPAPAEGFVARTGVGRAAGPSAAGDP